MRKTFSWGATAAAVAMVCLVFVDPALAIEPPPGGEPRAVPGPLIGAGAPALAVLAAGAWLMKKIRG